VSPRLRTVRIFLPVKHCVKMYPNLSFWGQNDFFWGGLSPFHHTPSLDAYGASPAPPLHTGILNTPLADDMYRLRWVLSNALCCYHKNIVTAIKSWPETALSLPPFESLHRCCLLLLITPPAEVCLQCLIGGRDMTTHVVLYINAIM